jgi:hypothetical protein
MRYDSCSTPSAIPRWSGCRGCRRPRRPAVGQARGPEPDRLGQGPRGVLHDRAGGEGRAALAGLDDPGAHLGQHRHLPGHGGQAARLPADRGHAGEHQRGAPPAAADVRRGDHRLAGRGRLQRGGPGGQADRRRAPRLGDALPVRQRGERPRALRDDRPGDPRRPAGDHALRGGPRHHRHADGRGPLPARAQARTSRSSPPSRGTASWSTGCATWTRASSPSCTTSRC